MITLSERDIGLIRHMLRYCGEIDLTIKHFGKSYELFKRNAVYRNAISMAIFQIGELSNKISDEFKENHSNIPWHVIRGMINWFAHNYYGMDIHKIWETAIEDIPVLSRFCEDVLN